MRKRKTKRMKGARNSGTKIKLTRDIKANHAIVSGLAKETEDSLVADTTEPTPIVERINTVMVHLNQ